MLEVTQGTDASMQDENVPTCTKKLSFLLRSYRRSSMYGIHENKVVFDKNLQFFFFTYLKLFALRHKMLKNLQIYFSIGCFFFSRLHMKQDGKCDKVPLSDSRPPRCMISKWQGGASLVHLLWHFSLGACRIQKCIKYMCLMFFFSFIYKKQKENQERN